jgi:hypothetical protein
MKEIFGAVLLSLVAFAAVAYDATVTWKNATQDTAGALLPATGPEALRDTRVRFGTCNATNDGIATVRDLITVPASQLSLLVTGLPAGTFCFQAQHSTNEAALGAASGDGVSAWTSVVTKTFAPRKPKAPTSVVIS